MPTFHIRRPRPDGSLVLLLPGATLLLLGVIVLVLPDLLRFLVGGFLIVLGVMLLTAGWQLRKGRLQGGFLQGFRDRFRGPFMP